MTPKTDPEKQEEEVDDEDGTDAVAQPPRVIVSSVAVKLPLFFCDAPCFWFRQAEAQFQLKAIRLDSTKLQYLIASLDQTIAKMVMPALNSSSTTYDSLKDELLRVYDLTPSQRADHLLNLSGLGDRKPSALANEILSLVPDGEQPGYLEHQIFVWQLPASVRTLMVAHEAETDLRTLGEYADHYLESSGANTVFSIRFPNQCPPSPLPSSSGLSSGSRGSEVEESDHCFGIDRPPY